MRCFIAIDMPANVKRELLALQQSLTLGTAVRWTREDQLHLTLKFLSDIDDDALPAIKRLFSEVAAATPPFDFDIRGCGCFPPNGLARIVWAGIPDPPRALLDASGACESAFAAVGVPPENRPYRPHLTVGRVHDAGLSRRVREAVAARADFAAGTVPVREFILFQSDLTPKGSRYTVVARAKLGGGGSAGC